MLSTSRVVVLLGLIGLSFAVSASNYVGLDYKYRASQGRRAANYNVRQSMAKSFSSAEIYAIHRFDNNVGINVGYEQSANAKRNHTFAANELFLGNTQNSGDSSFTRIKIRAGHFDVVGFIDLNDKWEALGQLGVALMQFNIHGYTRVGGVTTSLAASQTYRFIPRIGLGLQYFPITHFGVRCLLNWEGTNMYRTYVTNDDGVRMSIRPYTQTASVALGIVGKF